MTRDTPSLVSASLSRVWLAGSRCSVKPAVFAPTASTPLFQKLNATTEAPKLLAAYDALWARTAPRPRHAT